MPAIQRSEFALALNQVANERGIDPSIVLETVENAILAAYRKDHPEIEEEIDDYSATLNPNTGEAKIFHKKEDATPPGFGRIAAQTAKQVILQKIREKEKEAIITDYKVKIGTIVNGMVLRFAGPNIIVDVGKAEGVMPPPEQISNERYHLNQRITVFLKEIHEGPKGEEVVVSRADNGLLEGLLKREVPEVAQGSVEVKAIEREPGNRAKIAVYSNQPGIDPVGSCVGQKGVRVQAIIAEFNGLEKIDIIQWQENSKEYIIQALSPAKNLAVEVDEEEKLATVKVPQEELSLAIGKDGQNVRLASKLTGYRIEIEGDETMISTLTPKTPFVEDSEGSEKEAKPKEDPEVSDPLRQSTSEASEAKKKKDLETAKTAEELEEAVNEPASEEPAEVAAEESVNQPLAPKNPGTDSKPLDLEQPASTTETVKGDTDVDHKVKQASETVTTAEEEINDNPVTQANETVEDINTADPAGQDGTEDKENQKS